MPEPIFAAIDEHRRLDRLFLDLAAEAEEGRATQADVDRANDVAARAAWSLARIKPTTVAGAAAMLEYIAVEPVVGLFDNGEQRWHETAFRTVTAALAAIARQTEQA